MCMLIAAAVSANGQTSVVKPGERPEVLIEGDVLDLGHGVQFTLEHLR